MEMTQPNDNEFEATVEKNPLEESHLEIEEEDAVLLTDDENENDPED